MTQPDHLVIQAFFDWVCQARDYAVLNPSRLERHAFIPIPKVEAYFERDRRQRLIEILDAIYFPETRPLYTENILPKYTAVFCILLHIGKGRYILKFTKHASLGDSALPFDPENPPAKFPICPEDPSFFPHFCDQQWRWCAPKFQRHMLNEEFGARTVLPITSMEQLGDGGSARLYKIKIHKLYNELLTFDESKIKLSEESASTFVLKKYKTEDARKYYENEVNAFVKLRDAPNIIDFYGSYVHGETFNMVLEFADKGDLERYFQDEAEPRDGQDIINFWKGLFKLLEALVAIHQVEPCSSSTGPAIFEGWHQDVKPQNIFVVSNDEKSPYNWQFKLGDLGLSHFKMKVSSSQESDSTARDAHGTKTYGAPETYRPNAFVEQSQLKVRQNVDIWSLGCVYSEAARWVTGGYKGVKEYRAERKSETDSIRGFKNGDCFHNGEKALTAVRNCHGMIKGRLCRYDFITELVIDRMIKPMLAVSAGRPTAMQSLITSQTVLEEAQEMLEGVIAKATGARDNPLRPENPPAPPVRPPGFSQLPTEGPGPVGELDEDQDEDNNHNLSSMSSSGAGIHGAAGLEDSKNKSIRGGNVNQPRCKSKNVSSDKDLGSTRAQDPQNEGIGVTRSGTGGITHPIDGTGSASGLVALPETCLDDTNTPPNRPAPVTISSAPPSGVLPIEQIEDLRSTSAPPLTQMNVTQPSKPHSSPMHTGIDRLREASHGSPSQPSQDWHEASHDGSKSEQISPAKPLVPYMSIKEALHWKIKRKRNINAPLPHRGFLGGLRNPKRDQVFIIDDSESMASHRKEVEIVFEALSYIVKECDPDGTDLYFTVSGKHRKSSHTTPLLQLLHNKSYKGSTDINYRLDQILDNYKAKLEQSSRKSFRFIMSMKPKVINPMNIYILTNGDWEENSTGESAIANLVQTLIYHGMDRSQVGIQLISFGNDLIGLKKMRFLANGLKKEQKTQYWLDIVNTEPADGNVWKMLLGAINPTFDGDSDDEDEDFNDIKALSGGSASSGVP